MLNAAAGLLAPSAGEVRVFGEHLAGINGRAGYLFQADALMPWKTALGNVAVGLKDPGRGAAGGARASERVAGAGGLGHLRRPLPAPDVGRMRKRCALAQVLILDPPILLMDEPFSALDIQTRHLMENLLLDLWSANRKSVLFITHDLEEAISLSDRVLLQQAGG